MLKPSEARLHVRGQDGVLRAVPIFTYAAEVGDADRLDLAGKERHGVRDPGEKSAHDGGVRRRADERLRRRFHDARRRNFGPQVQMRRRRNVS